MGDITDNIITNNTYGLYIDESGYSGLSGKSGYSGWSGWSGRSGFSGISGFSGAGRPPTSEEVTETAWTNATPGAWTDLLSLIINVTVYGGLLDVYGGFQFMVDANPTDVAIRLLLDGVEHEGGSRTLNTPSGVYGYHNTGVLWTLGYNDSYTVQMQYSCTSAMSISNRMLKAIWEAK